MANYVAAPEVGRDMAHLWDHIAAGDEGAARRITAEILAAFERLAEMPGLGHTRSDLTTQPLLFWPIRRRYFVIYRIRMGTIEIVRVLDGRRDVAALLG